jgi:hypothetical protein
MLPTPDKATVLKILAFINFGIGLFTATVLLYIKFFSSFPLFQSLESPFFLLFQFTGIALGIVVRLHPASTRLSRVLVMIGLTLSIFYVADILLGMAY